MLRTLGTLLRELGPVTLLRVGAHVRRAEKAGEPFSRLPAPASKNEVLSRAQIGPAILLYRALRQYRPDDAFRITQQVVVAEGIRFLAGELGRLPLDELESMTDEERHAFVQAKGERFFNATLHWDRVAPDGVAFTITACTFPGLCEAAGVPEVAPMFCQVDEAYFGSVEPGLVLVRDGSLASGQPRCHFILRAAGHPCENGDN